jgi:hypothetical protein
MKSGMFHLIVVLSLTLALISLNIDVRADDPLWARMVSPKYRNAIYPTMDEPQVIKIRLMIDLGASDLNQSWIDVQLTRNGNVIKDWTITPLSRDTVIGLPVSDIHFEYTRSGPYIKDDTPYEFRLELKLGPTVLDVETVELNRYPPPPLGVNEVRIDDNDNILINGTPSLILGSYLHDKDDPQSYSELERWGFNAVKSERAYMGTVNETMWFLVAVAKRDATPDDAQTLRDKVRLYREHPQTLAWYIADEPNLGGNTPGSTLRILYEAAMEEDPYHPAGWVSTLLSQPGERLFNISEYEGSLDFFGIDAYPCQPERTYLRNVTRNFERLRDPSSGGVTFEFVDLPAWGVPQMYGSGNWRWPELHEEKNMVYQYIALGAKALFPYAYYDPNSVWQYWGDTIIPELNSIEPTIFAPMISGTSLLDQYFPSKDISIQTSDPDVLVWSYRQTQDKEYLFLINTSNQWNIPLDTRVPGPEDKVISIEVTFHNPGSDLVEALIKDSNLPPSYSLVDSTLILQLDGVNEQSSGVLVLERNRLQTDSADINLDGVVDVLDVQLFINVLTGKNIDPEVVERADVDKDGKVDNSDLIEITKEILGM